jgi:hypothetical protein
MFSAYPTYNPYRTLYVTTPHQKGEDVFALQTALEEAGFDLPDFGADGDLGKETGDAILRAQAAYGLSPDGKAGAKTQTALANAIGVKVREKYGVAPGALYGQIQTESGFFLGNYSPLRADGTFDAGVVQRNTKYTDPRGGFDVADSLDALAERIMLYYGKFKGVSTDKRRWALAQGTWNAPAFACYIAREEGATGVTAGETLRPSSDARTKLEAYMASANAYVR